MRGALTPEGYLPRVAERAVAAALAASPALVIEGPRACGKTWTARRFAASEAVLDDSDDFVCVITDNDEGDWDAKESAYYASEEHAALEPVLAPLIAGGEVWFVNSVVPSD